MDVGTFWSMFGWSREVNPGPASLDSQPIRSDAAVSLRRVESGDLQILYSFQADEESNRVAVARPRSLKDFNEHWTRVLSDPGVFVRAIVSDQQVVGSVTCFPLDGVHWIGYWVGRCYWGRGVATQAVSLMLIDIERRPLFARIAASNVASCRLIERCGFVAIGTSQSPETERFPACLETTYRLDAAVRTD